MIWLCISCTEYIGKMEGCRDKMLHRAPMKHFSSYECGVEFCESFWPLENEAGGDNDRRCSSMMRVAIASFALYLKFYTE